MRKNILFHIPHSSLYIPDSYKQSTFLTISKLEEENMFLCDYKVDELLNDKSQAVIFPYSRLYCDVERFKDDSEPMNQYGMGYIYTKTSNGDLMFQPSFHQKKVITSIYDQHHGLLDDKVTEILDKYQQCIIIDLHSYSSELVSKLFHYQDVPDICIGIEEDYYSEEITNHFIQFFEHRGYSVKINYPYSGSLVPNKYYGKKNTNIVSIMIEINKRVYEKNFDEFKKILNQAMDF